MTNQVDNWQYDPLVTFKCTIGNQFEILMLIEMLELQGIAVMSANTDGIVCLIPVELEQKYYDICHEWERLVGNDKMGQLEYTDYKELWQTTVNDYLAIGVDGKVKTKGDFNKDMPLQKNKSYRVVPIAIEEYIVSGKPVEETIRNHRNIYDFCAGAKSSNDYYYEGVDKKTGHKNIYNKVIRYYISKSGEKLFKIKQEYSEKKGRDRTQLEAGYDHQTIFNKSWFPDKWEEYGIDEKYYIDECYKILDRLEPEKARDRKIKQSGALTLF